MASLDLGVLKISIGVDNREANKQIGETKSQMDNTAESAKSFASRFGSGFKATMKGAAVAIGAITTGALAVGTAFIKAAENTSQSCDTIDKASQRMGVSAEYYQELEYAVGQCGISMDTMERAAKELQKSGQNIDFSDAIKQILDCGTAEEKSAKAAELFGEKVAYELTPLLNTGAEGFDELRQQAKDYGLVLSNDAVAAGAAFGDSLSLMQQSIQSVKDKLIADFFPSLTDVMTGIAGIVSGAEGAEDQLQRGLDDFIKQIDVTLPKLITIATSVLKKLIAAVAKNLPNLVKTCLNAVQDILKSIDGAKFAKAVVEIITDLIDVITDNVDGILTAVVQIVIEVTKELLKPQTILKLTKAVIRLIAEVAVSIVKNAFLIIEAIGEILGDIVDQIFGGYEEEAQEVEEANNDIAESVDKVAEAQENLNEKLEDSRQAIADFKQGIKDSTESVDLEYKSVSDLWKELQSLCDENGNVDESNLTLAQNILDVLNQALGTEYELNGNQIVQYGEMCSSIDTLIEKKKALALASVWDSEYAEASGQVNQYKDELYAYDNYLSWLMNLHGMTELDRWNSAIENGILVDTGKDAPNHYGLPVYTNVITGEEVNFVDNNGLFSNENLNTYIDNCNRYRAVIEENTVELYAFMERYSLAQRALMEGDYDEAVRIMDSYSGYRWQNIEKGHQMSQEELSMLKTDLDKANWYLNWYKDNLEKGIEGFTQSGLAEAQEAADRLNEIWNDCIDGAYDGGEDIADGLADGLTSGEDEVADAGADLGEAAKNGINDGASGSEEAGINTALGFAKGIRDKSDYVAGVAGQMASAVVNRIKAVAMIASPSKLTRKFGQFISQGLGLGITDDADLAAQAAQDAMNQVLDIFSKSNAYGGFNLSAMAAEIGANESLGKQNINTITQNNYFTAKESTAWEQQLEIERLNRELVGVFG